MSSRDTQVKMFIDSLSLDTIGHCKNHMYSTIILQYMKDLAKVENKDLYSMKPVGLEFCNLLITGHETDDTLLKVFSDLLTKELVNSRRYSHQLIRECMKNMGDDVHATDNISNTTMKQQLLSYAEVKGLEHKVLEDSEDQVKLAFEYFYTLCINKMRTHMNGTLACKF